MSCRSAIPIIAGALAVILGNCPAAVGAEETLYHFLDEQGVPHFSNQPIDPRYLPLTPGGGTDAARSGTQAAAAEVQITAPEQAALGETFDVVLSLPQALPGSGFVELAFDPEAISLQAISVDASVSEPGRVRIDVTLDVATPGQVLASLSFQAVASAPTQVSLQVTQMELRDAKGELLAASPGAPASVRLVQ